MARHQTNKTDIDTPLSVFDPVTNTTYDDGILDDVSGLANLREQTLGRISAELDLFDKSWSHKVFADHLTDDFFGRENGATTFSNYGERQRFGYLTTARLSTDLVMPATHTLVGLMERIDESFENASQFGAADEKRSTSALAAEYRGAFANQFFLTGNLRYDDKDQFEDATTYRLTSAYLFGESGTRLHASYGKGITDPTFFEQFGFGLNFVGNPNLKPEESIGWDVGVEQTFLGGRLKTDLTYFSADLTDEIVGAGQTVINQTGVSERQGIELTLAAQLTPNWLLNASYTYMDATDPDGREEIRRPPHAASFGAYYSFAEGRGQIGVTAIYNGKMKDDQFGGIFDLNTFIYTPLVTRQTLDEYLLVNLSASYKLRENVELFGRIENLLDENYEEVFSYATAPVAAYGGIKMSLGGEERPIDMPPK
jgi:vitamin B12 transporter